MGVNLRRVTTGVDGDEVRAATGFDLRVSPGLSETPRPSPEMLRVLRHEVDPLGIRRLEFVPAQDRQQLLAECIAAEEELAALALRWA